MRSFIANKILDLQTTAESFGLSGISQTNGFVNGALNYLTYSRQPVYRGFSQLGGGYDNYTRAKPVQRDYSTWESAERAFSKTMAAKNPTPPSQYPRYQGKAFYEAADKAAAELRAGKARGDHKYMREEPMHAPPSRAAPVPPHIKKMKAGIDRGDHKYVREKPSSKPPTRDPPKPPKKKVMRPPDL